MKKLSKPSQTVNSGFTLIEILIVISIISILAAILFPVFARARENARRTSCLSNLKQIGFGMMMYIQDYDERFPLAVVGNPQIATGQLVSGSPYCDNMPCGRFSVANGAGDANIRINGRVMSWMDLLQPYTKSVQIFVCPSQENDSYSGYGYNHYINNLKMSPYIPIVQVFRCPSSNRKDEVYPRNGNYGATRTIFPERQASGTYTPVSSAAIVSVATTYMLMDSGTFVINASYARALSSTNYYLPGAGAAGGTCVTTSESAKADCETGRHFGGVNMTFADGHVKWLKSSVVVEEARKCGTTSLCAAYRSAWNPLLDNS